MIIYHTDQKYTSISKLHHLSEFGNQTAAVIFQPLLLLPVIRQDFGHLDPEPLGMVQFLSVTKLMDDHIIKDFRWHECQQAIEIQISLTAAAAPAGVLRPNGNLIIGYSDKRSIVLNPFRNQCASFLPKCFQFQIGKLLLVLGGTIGQVLLDPTGLALNEPSDIFYSHSFRSANDDIAIMLNLNCDGFPVTPDNTVLYRKSHVI